MQKYKAKKHTQSDNKSSLQIIFLPVYLNLCVYNFSTIRRGNYRQMKVETSQKIDRYSPMPVYQQIANDILLRISQDEWSIGDRLPTETELVDEYGASRVTVRQALQKLENDGLIDRQRGRGAFLKANPSRTVQELFVPQAGINHKSENIARDIVLSVVTQANTQVYSNLELHPGEKLVYLERNFVRRNKIVGINRAWFPFDLVPNMASMALINDSVTATLQYRYNIHVSSVENYIESIMLNATTAELLDTISPSPALKISSIYKTKDGKPIEYSETTWNGQDTTFRLMLSSDKL